ncbi:MAG: ankyrin repeat domain-containing protein [Candidatus Margulisiibacteriota bacterium]
MINRVSENIGNVMAVDDKKMDADGTERNIVNNIGGERPISKNKAKIKVAQRIEINPQPKNQTEALNQAMFYKDVAKVKSLIASGIDVNAKDENGCVPLVWAAKFGGRLEMVETLVNAGAKVKDGGNNAEILKGVLMWHKIETLKYLIKHGIDVNSRDKFGWTALMNAAYDGDKEAVEVLIAAGADIEAKNNDGDTALSLAREGGKDEVSEILLKPIKSSVNSPEADKLAVLFERAREGNVEAINSLIAAKADINVKDRNGNTLLICSAFNNNPEAIEVLISAKADLDAKNDDGATALIAVILKASDIEKNRIKALVKEGGRVRTIRDNDMTATNKYIKSAKLLINAGANLNAMHGTALMIAAEFGETQIVKVLLEADANVNLANEDGMTALMLARDVEIIKMLLAKGANVNAKDNEGKTALDYDRGQNKDQIIEILKEATKRTAK